MTVKQIMTLGYIFDAEKIKRFSAACKGRISRKGAHACAWESSWEAHSDGAHYVYVAILLKIEHEKVFYNAGESRPALFQV